MTYVINMRTLPFKFPYGRIDVEMKDKHLKKERGVS